MTKIVVKDGTEEPEEEPVAMVFINPLKDVFVYERPIGALTIEEYKHEAVGALIRKAMDRIEPEFLEQTGFEMMRYQIVVKAVKGIEDKPLTSN